MNKIIKIAITGGPCSGKSTVINKIINKFTDIGYKVLTIQETATELILSGINPFIKYKEDKNNISFQKAVFKEQLEKEKLYLKIAKKMPYDKILILCDRGLLDGQAYISKKDYLEILKENKLELNFVKNSYDAVFHLVTTAIGAEKFYTLENNKARMESINEAKLSDKKIQNAWLGCSKFKIIDNSTNFEGKINRLISEIYKVLGEPIPTEIERKYLIIPPKEEDLNLLTFSKSNIIQTYLKSTNPNIERRIRLRGDNGDFIYTYTEKTKSNLTRIEREKRISIQEYNNLLLEADTSLSPIYKKRYCFIYNNQYFELDYYDKAKKYAILEIELTDKTEKVTIPDYIKIIKEVTNDRQYKNHSLSKNFIL